MIIAIILLILIILFLIGSNFMKKYQIIKNYEKTINKHKNDSNYYHKMIYYRGDQLNIYETYQKDQKRKEVDTLIQENKTQKCTEYIDLEQGNIITAVQYNQGKTIIGKRKLETQLGISLVGTDFIELQGKTEFEKMLLIKELKEEHCNGKLCYKLYLGNEKTIWIDKIFYLPVRSIEFSSYESSEKGITTVIDYQYSWNQVTDEDIQFKE